MQYSVHPQRNRPPRWRYFRPHSIGTPDHAGRRRLGNIIAAPFSALNASLVGARKRVALPVNTLVLSGALLLAGFVAGALISTQWQAHAATATSDSPVTRQSDRQIVAATISRLETEQADLKKSIAALREQLNGVQGTDAKRKTTLTDINNEIANQRLASGMAALHGSGVVVTLTTAQLALSRRTRTRPTTSCTTTICATC